MIFVYKFLKIHPKRSGKFEVIKRVFVLGIVTFMNNYEKLNEKIPLVFGFWFNFAC